MLQPSWSPQLTLMWAFGATCSTALSNTTTTTIKKHSDRWMDGKEILLLLIVLNNNVICRDIYYRIVVHFLSSPNQSSELSSTNSLLIQNYKLHYYFSISSCSQVQKKNYIFTYTRKLWCVWFPYLPNQCLFAKNKVPNSAQQSTCTHMHNTFLMPTLGLIYQSFSEVVCKYFCRPNRTKNSCQMFFTLIFLRRSPVTYQARSCHTCI